MADILTRLKLDATEFDNNIKRSRSQTQQFDAGMKTISATVGKFAAGLGVAVGAHEAFNKAMQSNQTTSDMLANNLYAAQQSVDGFFKSLATGDWGMFNNGVIDAFQNLKTLSAMMDDLADKRLSLTYTSAEDTRDMSKWREIAMDKTNSTDVRIDAAQNYKGVVANMNKNVQSVIKSDIEALNKEYSIKSGLNVSSDDMKYFTKFTNTGQVPDAVEKYKEYVKLQQQMNQLASSYSQSSAGMVMGTVNQSAVDAKKKEIDLFKQENEFLIKQGWLYDDNDKSRQEMVQRLTEQMRLEEQIYNYQQQGNKLMERAKKGDGSGSVEKKKTLNSDQLISMSDAEIDNMYKNFIESGMKFENELKKNPMSIPAYLLINNEEISDDVNKSIKSINDQIAAAQEAYMYATTEQERSAISKRIKGLENQKVALVDKKDVSALDTYNTGLSSTLEMMLAVRNATQDGAAGWITYGVNCVAALNQTYQSLAKVIPALQVKAISEAVGSAASTPVIGWIQAGLAAATLIATFASLPKFETGGIVGGSYATGDRMLIRANAGELILNEAQQKNLSAKLTNNGGGNVNVTGEFRLKGSTLVAAVEKQQRFNNRTR